MEARLWHQLGGKNLQCVLCPHRCKIGPGKRGRCNVRENKDGILEVLNYGQISGIALDPIEKKPLYHLCPGKQILSVGSVGCNLNCGFCQNYESVRGAWPTQVLSPEQLVALAEDARPKGNIGIAFTYTEPVMWFEFVLDSARLAREAGLKTVLVTNGFLAPEPWRELLQHFDAVNIDLKGIRDSFYREHCGGRLQPVLDNLKTAAASCHVEITTLLIQGYNTDPQDLDLLFKTIAAINPEIPLHLSRYYPAREFTAPATDPELVRNAVKRGGTWLRFVYGGNLPESREVKTYCPQCRYLLVSRGVQVQVDISNNQCPRCKHPVNISQSKECV